jgi:hypothetical protein
MPAKLWTATLMMTLTLGIIIEAIVFKLADNQFLVEVMRGVLSK